MQEIGLSHHPGRSQDSPSSNPRSRLSAAPHLLCVEGASGLLLTHRHKHRRTQPHKGKCTNKRLFCQDTGSGQGNERSGVETWAGGRGRKGSTPEYTPIPSVPKALILLQNLQAPALLPAGTVSKTRLHFSNCFPHPTDTGDS